MQDPRRPQIRTPENREEDDVLQPKDAPGDVPDIAGEFTTSGTDADNWLHPNNEDDDTTEFLL